MQAPSGVVSIPKVRLAAHAIAGGPDIFTALGFARNPSYLAGGNDGHYIIAVVSTRAHVPDLTAATVRGELMEDTARICLAAVVPF